MRWKARQFEWTFPRPTLLMGIVNVTPDSFSDGGRYFSTDAAVAHGLALVAEGADLLDVGGESTRPNALPVPAAEERRRVLPVIARLVERVTVPISVDTRKVGVAREALAAGASVVNDVGAARSGPAMHRLVAETGAGYVCMHMQGSPRTMQRAPRYRDVVREVEAFLAGQLERLAADGVDPGQVVLDVGIGFGKQLEHNLDLIAGLASFTKHRRPLLLGVSRKSFISQLLAVPPEERLPGSLACACWAVCQGVQILRVHDVGATRQAVRLMEALRERGG